MAFSSEDHPNLGRGKLLIDRTIRSFSGILILGFRKRITNASISSVEDVTDKVKVKVLRAHKNCSIQAKSRRRIKARIYR